VANVLKKSVPHFPQQADGFCLPACAQMVLAYLDAPCSQADLARRLGTRSHIGTPHSHIIRLRSSETSVRYEANGTAATLYSYIERELPVIMFVQTSELPHWRGHKSRHALVVVGVDDESVSVLDPGASPDLISVPLGDLLLAWDETDATFAVLSRRAP